jgi:hypothetical protein
MAAIVPKDEDRTFDDDFESLNTIIAFTLKDTNCPKFKPCTDWVEIASDQILENVNTETATATISFHLKHEKGGNGKQQQLRIRIVNSDGDLEEEICCRTIDCVAPCDGDKDKLIEMTFDSTHDIIRECKMGRTYVIEAKGCGGSEHELYVSNLEFNIVFKI